ncbi:zeta toxin family protein [Rhodococcus sp. IEGM 1307]|uniref:zeta toxin family protein n=1 Tax=Rhodococcus sp. IEGM 1307 TaxID=3047091 RepID=UPI0024B79217|nr:zeta toxin family protein [Rhodococcus sp. IEGM 1307]MDI9979492.1 zeta toxin family protein [Rhodococcus sp. IEGM 1307]
MPASLSTPGGPLTIDAPHATINDRRYFRRIDGEPVPTRPRLRLHERILADWRASRTQVRRDRVSILMAGPPGAGKSTAQAHLVGGRAQGWRHLDADEFKLRLLATADADGSLQQLLPEELRARPGQPSRFYPNELSALVHIESNLLLETAVAQSLSLGENVIIDGTMAWKPWATELVTYLEREHYTIHIADVEASRGIATARIVHSPLHARP